MFYRINKIIAVGLALLILASTGHDAFGLYCIGWTEYVVRDEAEVGFDRLGYE